jgi:hypothetical protein
MNPNGMLKAPGYKRLKIECDELLSRFAFNSKLPHYNTVTDFGCSKLCRTLHTEGPCIHLFIYLLI